MESPRITNDQQEFLTKILGLGGPQILGKPINIVRRGANKYIVSEKFEMAIDIEDVQILDLSSSGYFELHSSPEPFLILRPQALELITADASESAILNTPNELQVTILKILRLDINQVYAWLVASLIAGGVSLYILILGIREFLSGNINGAVLNAMLTAASSFITGIFIKNYNNANDRLANLRSAKGKSKPKGK